nr:MAG TPA: hypothetical protein [Caudoviricetes sp.]
MRFYERRVGSCFELDGLPSPIFRLRGASMPSEPRQRSCPHLLRAIQIEILP